MSFTPTTKLFKDDYHYKVKIIGYIESIVGENPQYIAVSHGKIFNLVSCGAIYTSDGRKDIITDVEAYEISIEQLSDICKPNKQFIFHIPFDIVPYKDPSEYSKYRKFRFDNFDIFEIKNSEKYRMRVNLCWIKIDKNKFEESVLKYTI